MQRNAEVDLSRLEFHGAIDFVTIETTGKNDLPKLEGRPVWVVRDHYRQLAIHDIRPGDVSVLNKVFPDADIRRAEIAVDITPSRAVESPLERASLLDDTFRWVTRHLCPYDAPYMQQAKTGGYRHGRGLCPFNYRVPTPDEQLLYGLRDDGPVQVKVYRKTRDNGEVLDPFEHRVRMEVNLGEHACHEFGLRTLTDLHGFQFRRLLSPYFRMAARSVAARLRTERPVLKLVRERHAQVLEACAAEAWEQSGMQGARLLPQLRFKRHVVANQRIGKALHRLQDAFSREKIVLSHFCSEPDKSVLTDVYRACMADRITYRRGIPLIPFTRRNTPEVVIKV